jgi:LmbE family N-acetylglucosaminyl deacetylase
LLSTRRQEQTASAHAIVDDKHYADFQKIIASENLDAVMTHWMIDNHPDHQAIANLTYEAWKQLKQRFALYYYEVSEGGDTMQFGMPTQYVTSRTCWTQNELPATRMPARVLISFTTCRTRWRT